MTLADMINLSEQDQSALDLAPVLSLLTIHSLETQSKEDQALKSSLESHLNQIQDLKACVNGICSLGDWRPSKD